MSTGPSRSEYAASFIQQLITVTRRIFQEYWRDPTYLYSKLALCVGLVGALPYPFKNVLSYYHTVLLQRHFLL